MALKPSLRFAMLLLLLHAMAAFMVYVAAMPLAARLAMLMLVLLHLLYFLARDSLLLLPGSWCEILLEQGNVSVVARNGSGFSGQIESKTTASPYFVVLCIRLAGKRLPVFRTIFPDALGAGEFRVLCVYLRFAQ